MNKLIDIITAGLGMLAGVFCMLSENSLDMALFAVPFVMLGLFFNRDSRIRSLCLLFYGGALLAVAPMRMMRLYTSSLRPAAACLCPLFAYSAVNLRKVGFARVLVYAMFAFGGICFDHGRIGAVGCGLFLALAIEMMRTAYDHSIFLDAVSLKK